MGAQEYVGSAGALRQQTLANPIDCSGVGLHSGCAVTMTLRPADAGSGIRFQRVDGDARAVQAHIDNVVDNRMGTAIGDGNGVRIGTVEHLMAAFSGCGVDNVLVELDGPEVPIMDGSAESFVFLIECAGMVEQRARRRAIEVLKDVSVGNEERGASIVPGEHFSVGFEIEFDSPVIGRQDAHVTLVNGAFKHEVSRARTFGFEHEVDHLRQMGLALGGSLDNAIVVGCSGILNEGGLRYDDEFVRHKVLDSIGDLYLAGAPLIGHFQGRRSGHALNHELVKALLADHEAWRYTMLRPDDTVQPVWPVRARA